MNVVDWGLTQKLGSPARGGTAGFIAPELLTGAEVSVASELYAFGATLRAALGKRRAPEELERLVERCTSEAGAERPASAWAAISTLGRAELPRRSSAPEVSFPRGLVEALSEGRVLLVEAPAGAASPLYGLSPSKRTISLPMLLASLLAAPVLI